MSGGGSQGAQANVDIVTTNINHDPTTQKTKRQSDVAVTVPVNGNSTFVIGIQVRTTQRASATLTITNPPAMNPVKQPLNGPEVGKLRTAFPPPPAHGWVAFVGTVPPGPANPLSLQTELTVNSSSIPPHGFQVIPVVARHKADDWTINHYLIGTSIIPGPQQTAVAFRGARGRGEAPAMRPSTRKLPAKKKKR
jgi:hypothetical protein